MSDSSGYHTEEVLAQITNYDLKNGARGMVDLITSLWHWGDNQYSWDGHTLELHTGGWSGNEDIISALEPTLFWMVYWRKSERGGHYYFVIP
jgi:hypothetical protein